MYIRIAAEGSSKELAKLFKSIAEAFEKTEEKEETPEKEENDEREG